MSSGLCDKVLLRDHEIHMVELVKNMQACTGNLHMPGVSESRAFLFLAAFLM